MRPTLLSVLGLAAVSSLVACVEPPVHPAPEHVQNPPQKTQSADAPAANPPAGLV